MEVHSEANQELKSTESEIVDIDSICNPYSTADGGFTWFSKVPPEIFRIILSKLTLGKFEDVKQTLLNCRAVHPLWKSVMDELLEEKRLDTWRNVELSEDKCNRQQPYTFAKHKLVLAGSHSVLLCPPGIYNGMAIPPTSPVPSNSLTVLFESDLSQVQSDMLRLEQIDFVDFFVYNGTHLSSLVLTWIEVSPETLEGVLKATPNLIALSLVRVTFIMDLLSLDDLSGQELNPLMSIMATVNVAAHCSLPPLPNLRHMRIFNPRLEQKPDVWCGILGDRDDFHIYDWILEPYMAQLFSLDVHSRMVELGGKRDSTFPVLKRLSIFDSRELDMGTAFLIVPQLEVLCIGEFYNDQAGDQILNLGVIQGHLARFSGTLVEMHLDWCRNADTKRSYLQYYRPESCYMWSRKKVVFLKLKTLSIIYPIFSEELEALKDMLGVMPNLETLNFLRCFSDGSEWDSDTDSDSDDEYQTVTEEEVKIQVKTEIEQENYWELCPNLKRISARLKVEKEGAFFTHQRDLPI